MNIRDIFIAPSGDKWRLSTVLMAMLIQNVNNCEIVETEVFFSHSYFIYGNIKKEATHAIIILLTHHTFNKVNIKFKTHLIIYI